MTQFKQLSDWLSYFENSPRFAMQLGLERIQQVARNLNLLSPNIPIITVAGTNGKGSTVHALQSIYGALGFKVGVYTSPHLFKFNERIVINGQAITDDDLCEIFTEIETLRGEVALTYFETTTLAAMAYFCSQKVDIIILEVGIGGRLDATNLWDANLAIITTIDYDHEAHLGTTLEAIGQEKAGILRANQLAIFAASNPPKSIMEKARELGTKIVFCDKDYQIDGTTICFQDKTWTIENPKIHINAIAAALVGSYLLHPSSLASFSVRDDGLFQTALHGRQQIIPGPVNLLFDVSHNPQSVALLRETLVKQQKSGKIYAVFSALKDKNIPRMINLLTGVVDVWYSAPLQVSRAATKVQLLDAFAQVSKIHLASSIEIAFQNAYSLAKDGDWIIVFGSFYVVSAVMQKYSPGGAYV